MKKLKLKKPKLRLPKVVPRALKRSKAVEKKLTEAILGVPRITNETVADHREDVLKGARKFIYPLQQSKHNIVRTSLLLLTAVLIVFFSYCGLALYKYQTTSSFIYGVTKVIPFPVAKAGKSWVSYESYLFSLRRNMHYYQTQQAANFSTKDGKAQLKTLKQQAMKQVTLNAYVKQLATQHKVTVSDQAVTDQVNLVRNQNRLGSSQKVLNEVLSQFWGWGEADFRRELKQQLLQQAVVAKLDKVTNAKADSALKQLLAGTDFATLAGQVSEDVATKGSGGQYPTAITPNDANLAPIITSELFKLQVGQISPIINTGYTLEILKVLDGTAASVHASHIQFVYTPIATFTDPLQAKNKSQTYINF